MASKDAGYDLRVGIALHYGQVSYGNIGAGTRLDFTVIGRDVNLVSRIQSICALSGRSPLMSERFAALLAASRPASVGRYELKGFGEPVPLVVRGPQMSVTEPVPYAIQPVIGIATNIRAEAIYFRQVRRGNIVIGGPFHGPASIETCRAQVDPRNTFAQLEQMKHLAPCVAADSDEAAQAFRFDGARHSEMMPPRAWHLAGW